MNCRETERLLDTFFDGELDGRLMRDAALHITRCQTCERELHDKERVRGLLTRTIAHVVDRDDLGSIWAGVQAGIEQGERTGQRAADAVTAGPADAHPEASSNETSGRRRSFGRRAGGRSVQGGSRTARPGTAGTARTALVGRVSAVAGFGAVAVSLAVLLFPTEQELQPEALVSEAAIPAGQTADGTDPVVRVATPVKRNSGPSTASSQALAAARRPGRSRVETVALGPVQNEEPLSSEWTQIQAGALEYSGHAMSLWRESAGR